MITIIVKYLTIAAILLATLPPLFSEDNLVKNGNMNTSTAWKGEKSYKELDGNSVLLVKASERKPQAFYQEVDTRDIKDVKVTFRYKTEDYKGRGIELRGTRDGGSSTFTILEPIADGQWHDYGWRFSEIRGGRRITFFFEVLEGNGSIYFDDISIKPE